MCADTKLVPSCTYAREFIADLASRASGGVGNEVRYNPAECTGIERVVIIGEPAMGGRRHGSRVGRRGPGEREDWPMWAGRSYSAGTTVGCRIAPGFLGPFGPVLVDVRSMRLVEQ
jgi:hypothetical protein